MSNIYTSADQLIGRTPLLELVHIEKSEGLKARAQARDLALMDDLYRVTAVQPVDMFPHTHHVENVVRLERRTDK